MSDVGNLFRPLSLGAVSVRNRIAMAPCTRQRAHLDGTPTSLMTEYYRQRAGAGLIITEGISPSAGGNGYLFAPGLYTDRHEAAWGEIADAVHQAGGTIFAQLMHVGRLSDPLILPPGKLPVSASAVRPDPCASRSAGGTGRRGDARRVRLSADAVSLDEHQPSERSIRRWRR
jgi:N-ethylmaleimide reductase